MEEEKKTMSPFCEAIMDATESVSHLAQNNDSALVICSDGNTLAKRIRGNGFQIGNMIYTMMCRDQIFAVSVYEACRHWEEKALGYEKTLISATSPRIPEDGVIDQSTDV